MNLRACSRTLALAAILIVPQIRTGVDLVVVPVNVRDSRGKLVTGLTRGDFQVLEDGKPQTISNFDIDPQPLSAAIVIDDGMPANKLERFFPVGAAPIFVTLAAAFAGDDRVAALRYDSSVVKLSDFTAGPGGIPETFAAIEEIAATRPREPGDVLGDKGPGWLRSILNVLAPKSPSSGTTGGAPQPIPSGSTPVRSKPRAPSRVLHDAIHAAAEALQSEPEGHRKIILVLSDGAANGSNTHTQQETIRYLVRSEIQLYAVAADSPTFGSYGALGDYAGATGGDVYPGTSTAAMEASFSRVTEQARNQYVLGYVSTNTAGPLEVFRAIDVRTRDAGFTVTHREGYVQYPPNRKPGVGPAPRN